MTQRPLKAMVMSAGRGTRMMPLTRECPKPLIEVNGKTLLDYTLDELHHAGVKQAVVNVHYLADMIENHVQHRAIPEITISDERDLLLETGGGLKKAVPLLGDAPFLVCNTDAIFTGPTGEATQRLLQFWQEGMEALLMLVPMTKVSGFDGNGDFSFVKELTDEDAGPIIKAGEEAAPFAFTGLQILHPRLLEDTPQGPFSTRVLWQKAATRGTIFGCVYPAHWLHVGTPEGVIDAESFLT